MKRKIFSITVMALVVTVVGVTFFDDLMPKEEYHPYSDELPFVQSDITLANEDLVVAPSTASWKTTDISQVKHTVLSTFRGTVTNIDDPIDWTDNVGIVHGAIPITINVTENTKDVERNKYKKGDSFTFYVDSTKLGTSYIISSYEPEFEVGEDVIVHIAKSELGPMGEGGDNYFVELGDFGKYKIDSDKAFNKKYPQGKNINAALSESN